MDDFSTSKPGFRICALDLTGSVPANSSTRQKMEGFVNAPIADEASMAGERVVVR